VITLRITQAAFFGCNGTGFPGENPRAFVATAGGIIPLNQKGRRRDTPSLGHCDYQFYGSAAGQYFSPVVLFVFGARIRRAMR
jgi:hypothetical protein